MKKLLLALILLLGLAAILGTALGEAAPAEVDGIAESLGDALRNCEALLRNYAGQEGFCDCVNGALEGAARLLKPASTPARRVADARAALGESAYDAATYINRAVAALDAGDIREDLGPDTLLPSDFFCLVRADSPEAFAALLGSQTGKLRKNFIVYCAPGVPAQMLGPSPIGKGRTVLSDLLSNNGIYNFYYSQGDDYVRLSRVDYYAGKRILYALQNGKTAELTQRERDAMGVAQIIALSASGTELEREKQVHDYLCQTITYYTDDDPYNEDDCVVGALLNGRANCDGYSDAFYLCGALAGLEVAYQHGDSIRKQASDGDLDDRDVEESTTHMWNLVRVNGTWVMLDVTWDDRDPGVAYLYYNNGMQQAMLTHVVDPRVMTHSVAPTAGNELRNPELSQVAIASINDLYPVLRAYTAAGMPRISLVYPAQVNLRDNHETLNHLLRALGIADYRWSFTDTSAEVYDLQFNEHFRVCDTDEDALAFIDSCAKANVTDFYLYFTPTLAARLFANDHAGLMNLLGRSCLENTAYLYNEECLRVVINDATYILAPNRYSSLSQVQAYLRQVVPGLPATVRFLLADSIDFDTVKQDIFNCLYGMGVESLSWKRSGSRISIDLSYYDEFRMVTTRQQVVAYLDECRLARKDHLRVYCTAELYEELSKDNATAFFTLLRQAGVSEKQVYHNDNSRVMIAEEIKW